MATYSSGTETTHYLGGLLEKLTVGSLVSWKHLIGAPDGTLIQHVRRSNGTTETYYVAQDHVGSSDVTLDGAGNVVVRTSFDAFGKCRDDDWSGAPSAAEMTAIGNSTRRGYAGHEHLDNVDLTHMDGRVYDPTIGRFLSADPIVQAPYFGQSHNRYSYVFNNPLAFTDSSGFVGDCGDCYMTPAWDPAPRIWLWINMVHAAHTRAVMMVMVREFMREQTNIVNASQMGPVVRTRQPDFDDSWLMGNLPGETITVEGRERKSTIEAVHGDFISDRRDRESRRYRPSVGWHRWSITRSILDPRRPPKGLGNIWSDLPEEPLQPVAEITAVIAAVGTALITAPVPAEIVADILVNNGLNRDEAKGIVKTAKDILAECARAVVFSAACISTPQPVEPTAPPVQERRRDDESGDRRN